MSDNKSRYILTVVFFLILVLPYPLWSVLGKTLDSELHENRELAEKPVFSVENIETLPRAYDDYINDHLPFRSVMLRSYSTLEYRLFRDSVSYQVAFGKDGWLFHRDRVDGDPIAIYRGLNMPTEEWLENTAKELVAARDKLAESGIELVLFLPPMKERVYAEYMPDYFGPPAEEYALLRTVEYLHDHTDLRVVYPYDEMMEAKESFQNGELLFYKTDSHWNELGAYVGTVPLLKELGITIPPVHSDGLTIESFPSEKEDMTHLVNLENVILPGEAYRVTGYNRHDLKTVEGDFEFELRMQAQGADPRRVLFYHDSFGESMQDVLSSQFNETILVHRRVYEYAMIDRYKPDILIVEIAERGAVGGLLRFVND
ncbi:MAG: hypothetical protein IJQ21_08680 [Lachnospiraceae bacterium]|nr:hypothetical protein [Lachnospiraceae bacterium]